MYFILPIKNSLNIGKFFFGLLVKELTADWAPKRINIFYKQALFFQGQWTAVGKNG